MGDPVTDESAMPSRAEAPPRVEDGLKPFPGPCWVIQTMDDERSVIGRIELTYDDGGTPTSAAFDLDGDGRPGEIHYFWFDDRRGIVRINVDHGGNGSIDRQYTQPRPGPRVPFDATNAYAPCNVAQCERDAAGNLRRKRWPGRASTKRERAESTTLEFFYDCWGGLAV